MTEVELRAECTRVRKVREQCGLDPDTARVLLLVPGTIRGRRKRVAPGLFGIPAGEHCDVSGPPPHRPKVMVDCAVVDVERWLEKPGLKPQLAPSDASFNARARSRNR